VLGSGDAGSVRRRGGDEPSSDAAALTVRWSQADNGGSSSRTMFGTSGVRQLRIPSISGGLRDATGPPEESGASRQASRSRHRPIRSRTSATRSRTKGRGEAPASICARPAFASKVNDLRDLASAGLTMRAPARRDRSPSASIAASTVIREPVQRRLKSCADGTRTWRIPSTSPERPSRARRSWRGQACVDIVPRRPTQFAPASSPCRSSVIVRQCVTAPCARRGEEGCRSPRPIRMATWPKAKVPSGSAAMSRRFGKDDAHQEATAPMSPIKTRYSSSPHGDGEGTYLDRSPCPPLLG